MRKIILLIIILCFKAQASVLDCAIVKARHLVLNNLKLSANATFIEIQRAYKELNKLHPEKSLTIEAKRLINENDWSKALADNYQPWLAYGEVPIMNWAGANHFISSLDPKTPATATLLKLIHLQSSKNLPLLGFEGRRIKILYDHGMMDKSQFKKNLDKAYVKKNELHGISHDDLKGVFRSSPYDNIIHTGSSFDANGSRYFTRAEKDAMINNKYINASESNFKKISEDMFEGKVTYLNPKQIEKAVDEILLRTEVNLARSKNLDEKVSHVQQMKKDLVSVHPFLDGNGRTIRLLEDFLLNRYGLPPSLFPNENDLLMTTEEAIEYARQHMIKYVNEHIDYASNMEAP